MIPVESAIRAWVEPQRQRRKRTGAIPWRALPYGQRVLVFDTETTTDFTQRLLFGFFRVYENDRLLIEGIIVSDVLPDEDARIVRDYAARHGLPVYTSEQFAEHVFYPEVYALGTLCIGFNLPFDLSRVAIHAGNGKDNRRFRLRLTNRIRFPQIYVESVSNRAAFIRFAPKKLLANWERPLFPGRFLDLSTLGAALTGERHTLLSAGKAFNAHTLKTSVDSLGSVNRAMLTYGRQDVRATWALYRELRAEYAQHPFATFENERDMAPGSLPMGRIYSAASIAKQYLKLMGLQPLLQRQPRFNRALLGYGAAAYFGGRAEVRVRKRDVPIQLLDFTSMYPTVFILQNLQRLLTSNAIRAKDTTRETRELVATLTLEDLYKPQVWPLLTRFVQVQPNGEVLPVRMRRAPQDDYTISVGPLSCDEPRWYTLADVLAAKLLGGRAPRILRAIEFYSGGTPEIRSAKFRNKVELNPTAQFFKTVVEQRQIAKKAKQAGSQLDLQRLDLGLKLLANSGAYGIFAEVNVSPKRKGKPRPGNVYSDCAFALDDVNDERSGAFTNIIIASFVTGAARLVLAMLEAEVAKCGGTFAFCDTDSLAIVCAQKPVKGVPTLQPTKVERIMAQFDSLNCYDQSIVPHLLKREYADIADLRCYAISAKRYVLFRWHAGKRVSIVKASESGLGGIIGRTTRERTSRLARRIWLRILLAELNVNRRQRRRAQPLIAFDVPLRRKLPIAQPTILKRGGFAGYNRAKSYDFRIKPFSFMQSMTAAQVLGDEIQPIAPFERSMQESRKLPWTDFKTGKRVRIDWDGTDLAGTIPILRLDDYIERYRWHPEAKAAGPDGAPSDETTSGVLQRLAMQSVALCRVGKEINRLEEDDGVRLGDDGTVTYDDAKSRNELGAAIEIARQFPQELVAREVGMSSRRLRDILQGLAEPHPKRALALRKFALRANPNG